MAILPCTLAARTMPSNLDKKNLFFLPNPLLWRSLSSEHIVYSTFDFEYFSDRCKGLGTGGFEALPFFHGTNNMIVVPLWETKRS